MAGSALNFDATKISSGYGWFWVGLAIPGAGSRISLFTDGTPDATANPSAKHLGHTTDGWEWTAKKTTEDQKLDEVLVPVETIVTDLDVGLAANLAQTQDVTGVLQHLVSGFGTYSTAAGYEQITLGITTITYLGVALIFPTKADATKFMIYHLYKAVNDAGIANQVKRKGLGNNPVAFKGYGITTRAAVDQLGNAWKQI